MGCKRLFTHEVVLSTAVYKLPHSCLQREPMCRHDVNSHLTGVDKVWYGVNQGGGMQDKLDLDEFVLKLVIAAALIAILVILFVVIPLKAFNVISHYDTYQGTVQELTYPIEGSGVTLIMGSTPNQQAVTFQKDVEAVCALEVGHTYRIKTVTTYHKTRLYSFEELPPLSPCPQEVP